MDASSASWFVLLLGLLGANLPFLNENLLGLVPTGFQPKPLWLRLLELLLLYGVVGGIAYMLEAHLGNVFPQRWEFYAVTACLFLVFAFPGFVFRYLLRRY